MTACCSVSMAVQGMGNKEACKDTCREGVCDVHDSFICYESEGLNTRQDKSVALMHFQMSVS